LPFTDLECAQAIEGNQFELPMIPPSRLNLQVDPRLDQIVARSLALKPEERYLNAAGFLADLDKWTPPVSGAGKNIKSDMSSEAAKSAIGLPTSIDELTARKMATQAVALSRQVGKLVEAADLMEEAFNKFPDLRDEYEYNVKLWRKGIVR
jgi:eukaryotic-like serine/threonine-protein kinase